MIKITYILKQKIKKVLLFFFPLIILLIVWEIVSKLEIVNPLLFPAPSTVLSAFIGWYSSGELWRDVKESCWRMLIGFMVGGFTGVSVGILTGRNNIINKYVSPLIQILRPLPPVAIIPLVIVWLGIGDTAKIFSIAFAVFFPVWINAHLGAFSITPIYLWSSRLLCRSKLRILLRVIMPAALPSIIAGLRTSIAIAFIMVYISEIAGASAGIGYQISVAHLAYRIDRMVAALAILALAGAVADFSFAAIIRFVFPWTKNNTKL